MVLSYGADVDEGETQQVGDESTLSDSPSSNPSDDIGSIELTADSFGKLRLDQRAYLRIGEGDAVVTCRLGDFQPEAQVKGESG